ncbi:dihydroorotase [Sphingobacterium sp. lm-10]|uniref:dihydroorotase n=1 Tax=Sphingobacterium sp. lm-10 TaxID=2944904 RepID=UPI00202018F5|nr:dihydroorotase [Sphingobacterium sp. lm-10]MCL7987376.1 dihydroorotase [Sphingobacterium sp. lm-10]
MATVLITSATLVLPGHAYHLSEVDVLLEDGIINSIGNQQTNKQDNWEVIDAKGNYIAPGFFDLNANFGEPGLETKEDLQTGIAAAAAGGFTGIAIHPNTNPAIYTRSEVALLINESRGASVDVYPIGAISKKRQGEELAELYDMKLAGALAFSDGDRPVQQAGLMSRALLYSKGFDGLIMSFAQDESIAGGNKMNEGPVSTYLGMKGIPNLAEELMISRDLKLAAYHDARIHFSTLSTAEGVALIRQAKQNGLRVSCDVAAHHLLLTDESVQSFDSNFKVSPPLRTQTDVDALLQGVRDGVIDAVVSQHTPHEVEFKEVEFHIASDGIASLQTVLPTLVSAGLSAEEIVTALSIRSRAAVGVKLPTFEQGEIANFVLFDPNGKWIFDKTTNRSKASNSPWFGQELQGKVVLTGMNKILTRHTK